jgi:hypothetical protein
VNRLERDIRAVLRSQADAMQVPEPHPRSTAVTFVDTEPAPTQPERRNRWPIIAAAAAAVAIVGAGLVILTRDDDATDNVPTNQPITVAPTTVAALQNPQPPVEFTACVNPGPEVQRGTDENTVLQDGDLTLTRTRGYTWQSTVRDVSDPRLDGTWYNSLDTDEYTSPGGNPVPAFGTWTHRIENDEGAWEGSLVAVNFAGDESEGPLVLIGEGAYDGLTAVATIDFGEPSSPAPCPNTRGYIIHGTVPAPPVPQTGQ